jgi:hypothetical protein
MKRHRHTHEQVVRKLREGERLLNDGKDLTEVLRTLEVSEATWNRWRAQYGGMKASEAKRLKAGGRERAAEEAGGQPGAGHRHAQGAGRGKLLTPDRRRRGRWPPAGTFRGFRASGLPGRRCAPVHLPAAAAGPSGRGVAAAHRAAPARAGAPAVGVADGVPAAAP